ncbi:cell wall-binding protein [Clostridium botulinum]|uniref:Lysozyme n=1 Tax=Clostridium botulinum (strain Eklund 17B / Type B) TaxID=935198 RepID=B2TNU0_CLOBB|nr:cell wall binding repeat domain protein [Clostridium botulinum B str. Eklund 17B (NRP)]MBY6976211.1 glycoside hydrolase family protein [Clostridium botulinum]MBY7000636.1 glycoside hydrolase family protein [Clostridium botulinum]MCR1273399.1 glycoside hydrolase family protein [Clostridium botulinum]NFD71340.1 cell wall-binding protein [Clostridium botulinum]
MSQWKWCVENQDGTITKGWYEDNGKWYYLKDNGTMGTGWIEDKDSHWYYLDESGAMKTGWLKDKDKWYYLNPVSNGYKGEMFGNCTKIIDGKEYSFNDSGAWVEDSLVSSKCIDFIKSWEGFIKEGKKYYDCVGVLTQGYGLTGDEIKNLPEQISEPEAAALLKKVVNNKYAKVIKDDLDSKKITLKQHEFDALVSFAYNCGTVGLLGSTLYRNVCSGIRDKDTINSNFQAWSNGGGKRIEGLYRRRTKEADMFLNADYTGNL